MILDHRGQPVTLTRFGCGFVPSAPVIPKAAPVLDANADPAHASAIGFTIDLEDEDEE